jgi:hypothetical protein
VLWEWHLTGLGHSAELLVSELVTNAITASRPGSDSPVQLCLLSDTARVVIMVWDASPHLPVRAKPSTDAETGRGLLLVEMISDQGGCLPDSALRESRLGADGESLSQPAPITGRAGRRTTQRWIVTANGRRLRQLRRQHGLSQEMLAAVAGISLTTVGRLNARIAHHAEAGP